MRRYKLISCGVLRKELDALRSEIPDDVQLIEVWLEQGLHREPARLNKLIKQEISLSEEDGEPLDAILLGYGICSSGTVGVKSSRYRIVVPRAHDCITLFLGSKDRYLDEFSKAPGTWWFTPGFMSGKMQPGMSEKYAGVYHEFEEQYEHYLDRFGDEDLARYVIENQEQAWIKNYSRGAYVESGLPGGDALRNKALQFCKSREWIFETIQGDFSLIRDLISGNWDEDRFLVLEPGEILVIGGVDDVIQAQGVRGESASFGDDYEKSYVFDGDYREVVPGTPVSKDGTVDIVIGIDAGGTYTDAVIVSLRKHKVLKAGKAPTTHHDLSIGIRNALEKLPESLLKKAGRLAISTTLATNSIVEEKGARTGIILIGYSCDTASMVTIGTGDMKEIVDGCHDIYGNEIAPLDEDELLHAADSMIEKGMEAIAVSSYMGTRNPDHEIRARSLLSERFSVPVVTGHELTDDIDSVRRAHTVLLNARLLPVIDGLVNSIIHVAHKMNLPGDIRLVTTDGTLMNVSEAKEQPVRLVLSGPAASVKGVRFLTSIDSCVLIDMGGTTTDIAVIEGGAARRTGRGAFVGKYKTSIHATDIRTVGLGGDSEITWVRGRLHVGPHRVVPVSVLAEDHSHIQDNLKSLRGYSSCDYGLVQPGIHFVLVRMPDNSSLFNERERAILRFLSDGPLSVIELAERLVYPYLSLLGTERLEELGIIRKSGLTPTDLMVAEGLIKTWDPKTAEYMIELYAERSGLSTAEFISRAWDEIHLRTASAVITEVLAGEDENGSFPGCRFCSGTFGSNGSIKVSYRLEPPLVGIGAPARIMLDRIDKALTAQKKFPKWAEVANAVGAASGTGEMHIDMTVIPDGKGRFLLYSPGEMKIFRDLEDAKNEAVELSKEFALDYARRMDYKKFSLDIRVRDRSAPTSFETELYIDTSVVATMKY